ncbi:Imm49 family immunity protein [Corticibacter populi]|nr:Imm49 family immunity protein [Corticibacter populi]
MLQYETNGVDSVENLLWPLISDNQEVIDWYRDNRRFYESADSEKKNQILSHEFYRLQIWRALNGLFAELRVDCEKALSQSEKFSKMKPRLVILRFLHALSIGDKAEMTRILLEMYSRKLRSRSFAYESGITCQFIVSYATLLAKLAWRHGYELDLDTPWIPREWLPIQPNEKYEDPWPFMQEFDIWQPFAEPWAAYSPQRPQT